MFSRAAAIGTVAVLLIVGCTQGPSPPAPSLDGTRGDATPYPASTALPTLTPYPPAPTFTPQPTYTPLPTGTPYPTPTALPTPTPYPPAPTYTPQPTGTPYPTPTALPTPTPYPPAPTYTPQPTGTPYPTPTTLPTPTPYPVAPTYTPQPTYTPAATPTPYPTPTSQPTPTPLPTPTSTPAPLLPQLHDTQNTRWISRSYPDIARQIQEFPWVQDGFSEFETRVVDELLYLGVGKIDNLQAVLRLPWVQNAISDTEYDVLYHLRVLDYDDPEVVTKVVSMPFLASPDATDALALRAIHRLTTKGVLSALVDTSIFQNGISDAETTLVAAVGTFYRDADAVRRVLTPGNAAIESIDLATDLTPGLRISIVRTVSQSRPGTVEAVRDAVEFIEGIMGLALPIDHVIVVLDEDAVSPGAVGTNYGFAFSYSPEYETKQGTYEWRILQGGFIHEAAHYYWGGNAQGWINEGVANTFEYMHGRENGLSRGQLETRRKDCEAHDLQMLAMWDPSPGNYGYKCSYYLGEQLYLELLEVLGRLDFAAKLHELYLVALAVREAGEKPGIAEVRQVFVGQQSIVEKHWSGALNAPENRPFDEGVDRTTHDVVKWDQHPTYDGDSVTFSGTLLDGAVLSKETIEQARHGGYLPFKLANADSHDYVGTILPFLTDGRHWDLNDPGDTVATTFSLDASAKSFTVTFPFPGALSTPSEYVVVVWGFQDESRTPRIGDNVDNLGYARIRVP